MKSVVALLFVLLVPVLASAQGSSVEERLQRLEAENRRILRRLAESEARNAKLESEVTVLRAKTVALEDGDVRDAALEQELEALVARIEDPSSQITTRSGYPLQIYGFLRLDAYYNDSRALVDSIFTFAALPEVDGDDIEDDDDAFSLEARLVRIGFDLDAGEIAGADVRARLETDFTNLITARGSRQTPRIRLAYIEIDLGEVVLRLGQDWDVIAPLVPLSINEFVLWGLGNVGDRRPQIKLSWSPPTSGTTDFLLRASLAPSGSVDGVDNDGSPDVFRELDGYDAGHPQGQLRVAMSFDTHVDEARGTLGVWGYVAGLETDTAFGGRRHFVPWVVGADLRLPLIDRFTLRAEAWYGQALSDIRGNIIQNINQTTGEEIRGYGGFAELHFRANDRWLFGIGASIDNPFNRDLVDGQRSLNWSAYFNTRYDFGNGFFTGLDLQYIKTHYAGIGTGDVLRLATYVQLNF